MGTQTRAEGNAERDVDHRKLRGASTPGQFELLGSKLTPPQLRTGAIPRPELLERLAAAREQKVVMLSAPPGYGKTTLLSQWKARSRRSFGWVTLDDRDNDPVVLLSYIAAALDGIEELPSGVFEALASPIASIDGRILPRLGSALAGIEASFVLVLDEAHTIVDPQCLGAIDVLVDHLPAGSQLVLSGQVRPSHRVGSLRAHGQLLKLRAKDLRMDASEAAELLAGVEVELADGLLGELVKKTEGWPAGLYLAALSIRDGTRSVASFGGDDRFVTDYLRDELLAGLPDDTLSFLTRTAVLDEMCGDLCDFTLDSDGSAVMLESLERSNLFVVPLDEQREWFRYHNLFRDLLRAELERAEPELIPDLLGRAADWCDLNERPDQAVTYAQAAEDVDRVARLVTDRAQREYQLGRAVTVERWLVWLEEHAALETVPLVAVLGAWFSGLRGEPGQSERWADAAERGAAELAAGNGSIEIQGWLALLRAAHCEQGVERMRADAELAEPSFPRGSASWISAAIFVAISRILGGDPDVASDILEDIAEAAPAVEAWNAVSLSLAERGILAAKRGDWVEAEALSEEAQQTVQRSGMSEYPTNALAYALAARVAAHRKEEDRAEGFLAHASRLRPRLTYALLVLAVQVRLELASAYVALADVAGARTLLREADGLMRRGSGFGSLEDQARELHEQLESVRADVPGASTLTTAELRLLPYLPTHLSFREIGESLFISKHTVKSEAMSIYRKLDVTSRNEAVERARSLGLLDG